MDCKVKQHMENAVRLTLQCLQLSVKQALRQVIKRESGERSGGAPLKTTRRVRATSIRFLLHHMTCHLLGERTHAGRAGNHLSRVTVGGHH